MLVKQKEKREVIKSNSLIESSYRLTTLENRLIDMALSKLEVIMLEKDLSAEDVQDKINTSQFELIEINASDYKKEFRVKTNSIYQDLEETTKKLYNRTIGYIEDNKLIDKRWVITCQYNEANNSVGIKFHPDLVPELMVFKNRYTIFDFDVRKHIKSYYTCRIYELLKQYQRFGMRKFTLSQLRFYLGVEDNEYPLYSNFKQKVIIPAVKQINETTDLYCEFIEIKNKNKVESLNFKFVTQKVDFKINDVKQINMFDNDETAITIISEDSTDIVEEFRNILGCTITKEQIIKLLSLAKARIEKAKKDGEEITTDIKQYIREKKAMVDNYAKRNYVGSYFGAIISAVKTNWTLKGKSNSTFHNYEQRNYTDVEFKEIEKKLLSWGDNVSEDESKDVNEYLERLRNKEYK